MFSNKFRELVAEPKDIPFSKIKVVKVLEYYHARNDVIHCSDFNNNHFVIKLARLTDTNFSREATILRTLKNYSWLKIPTVIEAGSYKHIDYLVLTYKAGFRISQRTDYYNQNSNMFCRAFGRNIGLIHTIKGKFEKAVIRKFHTINKDTSEDMDLKMINSWLVENQPGGINACFVHGDHHYANILWSENGIEATLDWELAGIGNKEYDLAWATVVRPGQQFFLTQQEESEILNGYQTVNTFNFGNYQHYKVLVMSHFLKYRHETDSYYHWFRREIKMITNIEISD